jgi:hypothetical protein
MGENDEEEEKNLEEKHFVDELDFKDAHYVYNVVYNSNSDIIKIELHYIYNIIFFYSTYKIYSSFYIFSFMDLRHHLYILFILSFVILLKDLDY